MIGPGHLDEIHPPRPSRRRLQLSSDLELDEAVGRPVDQEDRRGDLGDVLDRIGPGLGAPKADQMIRLVEGLAEGSQVHQHQLLAAPRRLQLLRFP